MYGDAQPLPRLGGTIAFDARKKGMFMQASKLGQTIFVLRALGARFSLRFPHTAELVVGGDAAYAKLPHLLRPGEALSIFDGPHALREKHPDLPTQTLVMAQGFGLALYADLAATFGARSVTVCHLGNLAYWHGRKLRWDPRNWNFGDDQQANGWLDYDRRDPWQLPTV